MVKDIIESHFSSLIAKDEPVKDYPGNTPPKNRAQRKAERSTPSWDDRPRIMELDGEEVEFFLIGDMAAALDKSTVTLRKWEDLKILPTALWRTETPRGPQAQGSTMGKRLYTRAQVELVLRAARMFKLNETHLVMGGRKDRPSKLVRASAADWDGFAKYLHAHWSA